MPLIPAEALPYFENMIYLPMVLVILERDRESFEKGPFKLKRPYINMVEEATRLARAELKETHSYLRRRDMKVIRNKMDDTFTEYVFIHGGYEDHRRYLNVRLRNRTEELLSVFIMQVNH
ncbi:hypothetical protein FITA111629_13525 [Filibacter tadaridae]|uniref:YhjD n=1 Tax=Filibacter tadaridae TaxID=2483811 RepID=A0A3P5X8A0_9BACL|nr:hypothetical protein [Filibacter tadaridae]VDC24607.1 hypothetical protein FILTAD_01048 [Filibacter tadaridae]